MENRNRIKNYLNEALKENSQVQQPSDWKPQTESEREALTAILVDLLTEHPDLGISRSYRTRSVCRILIALSDLQSEKLDVSFMEALTINLSLVGTLSANNFMNIG